MLYSLRSNGRYQLMVFGSCAVGLVYFALQSGVKVTNIKALVMALAYCWGLVLAIYLMGHGLVAIPRQFFRSANVGATLRRIQGCAPAIHDKLEDAVHEVDQLESQVVQLQRQRSSAPRDLQDWIEDLSDLSRRPDIVASSLSALPLSSVSVPSVVTERYLADLTRQLTRARHKKERFLDAWANTVDAAAKAQAILDSSASKALDFGRPAPYASMIERVTLLTPHTRYLLHVRILPVLRCFVGGLFGLASICIIWSELIKYVAPKLSVISFTVVHLPNSDRATVGFPGQLAAAAWTLYMCAAALSSFNDVKVWGNRALVRRNTYGESGCWYASQTAKLTVPLAYNFITFLPDSVREDTTFYHFLGRLINLTPLGKGFDIFFPIFILVPVCATLFNLYGRVKRICGFDVLEDEDEENPTGYGTGGWREGRDLIEREWNGNSSIAASGRIRSSEAGAAQDSPVGGRGHLPAIANNPRGRTAPTLSIPPDRTSQRRAQEALVATDAADPAAASENVFSDFAHRVRNTIDTAGTPRWMKNIGESFKKPNWTANADGGRGVTSWFAGRSSEGRLRL